MQLAMDYDVSMNSPLPIVVFITHHANERCSGVHCDRHWILATTREICAVHSHSEESSLPDEFSSSIQYHWLGDNVGFAAAVNWIFTWAVTGPVFIVNDDTLIEESCMEALCNAAVRNPTSVLQPEIRLSIIQIRLKTLVITLVLMAQIMPMNEDKRLNTRALVKDCAFRGAAFWIPEVIYTHRD